MVDFVDSKLLSPMSKALKFWKTSAWTMEKQGNTQWTTKLLKFVNVIIIPSKSML